MIIRPDLSNRLLHLTRDKEGVAAFERLAKIVLDQKLIGSSEGIRGKHRCVCFSETPISQIPIALLQEECRYQPYGVLVTKEWLFGKGGRPAIYQPDAEYSLLLDVQQYRHVRYQPGKCDHTWEREWRIACDELQLEAANTTLVVPTREHAHQLQSDYIVRRQESLRRLGAARWTGPYPHVEFPWGMLVLDDLGFHIPAARTSAG